MLELIGPEQPLAGLRYLMLIGTLDPGHDDGRLLAEQLRAGGGKVRLDVIEGLGHDYPTDFAQRLPAAVQWVVTADVRAALSHDRGTDPRA
jgi:acetyl esterase/lipase